MNPVSPLPIFLTLAVALLSVHILDKFFRVQLPERHASAIDGLRGYLAFGVFLHHACIWYFFVRSGSWALPPSQLYAHLGQTSVVIFFMITAYLFLTKILDAQDRKMDWGRLYVSRAMRIFPLWLTVEVVVQIIKFYVDSAGLDVSDGIGKDTARNALVTAGVTWTLRFEWAFYLLLPLLALAKGIRAPALLIGLSLLVLVVRRHEIFTLTMFSFTGGLIAAVAVRNAKLQAMLKTRLASCAALAVLGYVIAAYPTAYELAPVLWLSAVFTIIAAGNSLFGILTARVSRVFGEITFSIYLLHGMLLYVVFRVITGLSDAAQFSTEQHWLLIMLITPALIAISFFSFARIEAPAMQAVTGLTERLKLRFDRLKTTD